MAQAEASPALAYDSDDLAFFQNVLDNLVEEHAAGGPSANGSRDAVRHRLGARLFECAHAGERDYAALRQRILSSMFSEKSDPRV